MTIVNDGLRTQSRRDSEQTNDRGDNGKPENPTGLRHGNAP
jgi:hypothetical protein